jgi:iron complex outermembrane receptor protein
MRLCGMAAFTLASVLAQPALAQRANENAVNAAEDAFGTRIGSEDVGLYSASSARGFNPQDAGNMRLEGIYFDQQSNLCGRIQRGQTIRVGLPAQDFAFPAPTGIVDITIYQPTGETMVSTTAQVARPHGLNIIGADYKTQITEDLGMHIAYSHTDIVTNQNSHSALKCGGTSFKWQPNENFQLVPYFSFADRSGEQVAPFILTGGAYLPPRIDRLEFFGQDWAQRTSHDLNYGGIAKSIFGAWRIEAGLFQSSTNRLSNYAIFFRNTQPTGIGNLDVQSSPKHRSASVSGEVKATGVYTQAKIWRHTINVSVRGRDVNRKFGGNSTFSYGPRQIGVYQELPEPVYTYGVRDVDKVRQITPGAAYTGRWANVGAVSLGIQKSFYRRTLSKENLAGTTTRSEPWLYYGTVAFYATDALTVYGSYTRGLEEFGTAPDNAVNGGEPLPAGLTKQIDAGLRYQIMPGLSAVAGVFEITKPYFDRDPANLFTNVGNLRHRGVEFSLTGEVSESIRVVAGGVFLQPRVSGPPVNQGLIGSTPRGTPLRNITLNVQYGPPTWKGIALDATLDVKGPVYANRLSTFRLPSQEIVGIGARFPFQALGARFLLRTQINNLFNRYDWSVDGASGRFSIITPRVYYSRLAMDF